MFKRKRIDESWLTQEAKESLNPALQERILVILHDLSMWMDLKYAYLIGSDGAKLTQTIGTGGKLVDSATYPEEVFYNFIAVVEEYLTKIKLEPLTHITIELEDELLFIGATKELFLVAAFEGNVARGYMSMKLAKRVSHLKRILELQKQRVYDVRPSI